MDELNENMGEKVPRSYALECKRRLERMLKYYETEIWVAHSFDPKAFYRKLSRGCNSTFKK
jgi:hypothetical protein